MGTVTRDAEAEDAQAIAAIYNQSVLHSTATFDVRPHTAEERAAWLASHDESHPVLVAEVGGRVVGWASLSAWSDRCAYARTAEVSVYVDEAARGAGVGSALMRDLIGRARVLGMHALLARVCTENEVSLRLSRRFGFEDVGVMREVGEKFGRLLDVAVLELLV